MLRLDDAYDETKNKYFQESSTCDAYQAKWKVTTESLGKGSYGSVYKTCHTEYGCQFTAKEIKFSTSEGTKLFDLKYYHRRFIGESLITMWADKNHFGVPFYDAFFCSNGEKGVILTKKYTGSLDKKVIYEQLNKDDIEQILTKIKIMHGCGILHQDLFFKNMVYRDQKNRGRDIRFIDFGLSIAFGEEIPPELKAIDYITVANDMDNLELKQQILRAARKELGKEVVNQTSLWINNRAERTNGCLSEHFLIDAIPERVWQFYGPSALELLAWSSRCSRNNKKSIREKLIEQLQSRDIPLY